MKRVEQPSTAYKCRCTPGWNWVDLSAKYGYHSITVDEKVHGGNKPVTTIVFQFPYLMEPPDNRDRFICPKCGTIPFRIIPTPPNLK